MHQEWQRRQTQRSVWALLGLLTLVSAAGAQLPAVVPPAGVRVASVQPGAVCEAAPGGHATGTVRARTANRYWRHLAGVADTKARLCLVLYAELRPVVSTRDVYLRRFLRPPTA